MRDNRIRYIFGISCAIALAILLYQFTRMPGGMILPGFYFGLILLVISFFSAMVVTVVILAISKSRAGKTVFYISFFVSLLILHYEVYSPRLHLVVPENFSGSVRLVLRDSSANDLEIDEHGIGYLRPWFFKKTYLPPIVKDKAGRDLSGFCVPFNNAGFWALGRGDLPNGWGDVHYLSFEIDTSIGNQETR